MRRECAARFPRCRLAVMNLAPSAGKTSRLALWGHPDLLGLVPSQGEMIATHLDLERIAQRREADQFDGGADEQSHFHQATTMFGRDFDFGDDTASSSRHLSNGLTDGGHGFMPPALEPAGARQGSLRRASS